MIWNGWKTKENCNVLVNQFHVNFNSKALSYRKIKSVFREVIWCFNASWGLKELKQLNICMWAMEHIFQFEIIINVLVSFFRFIWIPVVWIYDHYKLFYSFSAVIYFRRQNLTSIDVRFWRFKSVPWNDDCRRCRCYSIITTKCVFKYSNFQMFRLKLNKHE